MKGCQEHFRAQVTRIQRNNAIIGIDDKERFPAMVKKLLNKNSTEDELNKLFEDIDRMFPRAATWLAWWKRTDIRSMIFPGYRKMSPEMSDALSGNNQRAGSDAPNVLSYKVSQQQKYGFKSVVTATWQL